MSAQHTVLLVGGTGRTGGRVLQQLLERGVNVRAIVRSAERLPADVAGKPGLTVIEADLLTLSDADLLRHARGCDAVISCLGHTISLKGVLGAPHYLVAEAVERLCRAIRASRPEVPVKFILMSSVSVNRAGGLDTYRGAFDRFFMWMMRGLVPPARDNQRAADILQGIGTGDPYLQWVAVRPDTLLEEETTEYSLHEGLVSTLFKPDSTNMGNVAHFMCELATNQATWGDWAGKLPVIINDSAVGE